MSRESGPPRGSRSRAADFCPREQESTRRREEVPIDGLTQALNGGRAARTGQAKWPGRFPGWKDDFPTPVSVSCESRWPEATSGLSRSLYEGWGKLAVSFEPRFAEASGHCVLTARKKDARQPTVQRASAIIRRSTRGGL